MSFFCCSSLLNFAFCQEGAFDIQVPVWLLFFRLTNTCGSQRHHSSPFYLHGLTDALHPLSCKRSFGSTIAFGSHSSFAAKTQVREASRSAMLAGSSSALSMASSLMARCPATRPSAEVMMPSTRAWAMKAMSWWKESR